MSCTLRWMYSTRVIETTRWFLHVKLARKNGKCGFYAAWQHMLDNSFWFTWVQLLDVVVVAFGNKSHKGGMSRANHAHPN